VVVDDAVAVDVLEAAGVPDFAAAEESAGLAADDDEAEALSDFAGAGAALASLLEAQAESETTSAARAAADEMRRNMTSSRCIAGPTTPTH